MTADAATSTMEDREPVNLRCAVLVLRDNAVLLCRCLLYTSPYGEGIVFWALGEIVKAECGILESDTPQAALAKLDHAIPEHEPDRAWLTARLAPLVLSLIHISRPTT